MKKRRSLARVAPILVLGAVLLGIQGFLSFGVSHAAGTPPPATQSWYKTTLNTATSQNEGCVAARGSTGLVILDYGEQYISGGVYGALLTGSNVFASDSSIQANVIDFLRGANQCSLNTTNLKVAVGTSNDNSEGLSDSQLTTAGNHWAGIVNAAINYIKANSHITVFAADDIEIGFSTYHEAKAFLDGYDQQTQALIVNFGDDPSGSSSVDPDPARGWTAEALWYVTTGAPNAVVVPEIYTSGQRPEWVNLDAWACQHKGRSIAFYGTISDYPYQGHYTPDQAWTALYNGLTSYTASSRTVNACVQHSAARLYYSTRISS